MGTATATRETFCTRCTRLAPLHQLTLDADHPMVNCSRMDSRGEEHGCGVQPGTYDEAEAVAVVRERKRVIANAHHREHVSYRKPNANCDECRKSAPVKEVQPHPFEAFPRKYRTAAHIELVHHNRDLYAGLPMRSAQELEEHHRGLHEAQAHPGRAR